MIQPGTEAIKNSPQKIRLFSGPGTRRWPRLDISEVPSIKRVSLGDGSKVKVINISQGGALLQTLGRMALRTKIKLNLETTDRVLKCRGVVIRTGVTYSNGLPRFQAAVSFDSPLPPFEETRNLMPDAGRLRALETASPLESIPEDFELLAVTDGEEGSAIIESFLSLRFDDASFADADTKPGINEW